MPEEFDHSDAVVTDEDPTDDTISVDLTGGSDDSGGDTATASSSMPGDNDSGGSDRDFGPAREQIPADQVGETDTSTSSSSGSSGGGVDRAPADQTTPDTTETGETVDTAETPSGAQDQLDIDRVELPDRTDDRTQRERNQSPERVAVRKSVTREDMETGAAETIQREVQAEQRRVNLENQRDFLQQAEEGSQFQVGDQTVSRQEALQTVEQDLETARNIERGLEQKVQQRRNGSVTRQTDILDSQILDQTESTRASQEELVDVGGGMQVPESQVEIMDPITIEGTPPLDEVLEQRDIEVLGREVPEGAPERAFAGFETITSKDGLDFLSAFVTGEPTDPIVAESIERQAGEDEDILGETGELIQSPPGLVIGGKGVASGVSKAGSAIGGVSARAGTAFTTGAAATGAGLVGFEVGKGTGELAQGNTQEGVEDFLGAGLATAGAAGRTPRALTKTPELKLPTETVKTRARNVNDFVKGDLGMKTTESGIVRRGGRPRSDLEQDVIPESPTRMRTVEQDDGRVVQEFFSRESTGDVRGFRIREPRTRREVTGETVKNLFTGSRKGQVRLARQKQKQRQKQKEETTTEEDDLEVIDIDARIARKQALRDILALKPRQTDVAATGFVGGQEATTNQIFPETRSRTPVAFPQQDQGQETDLDLQQDQPQTQEDVLDIPERIDLDEITGQEPVQDTPTTTTTTTEEPIDEILEQPPRRIMEEPVSKTKFELPEGRDDDEENGDILFDPQEEDIDIQRSVAADILGLESGRTETEAETQAREQGFTSEQNPLSFRALSENEQNNL